MKLPRARFQQELLGTSTLRGRQGEGLLGTLPLWAGGSWPGLGISSLPGPPPRTRHRQGHRGPETGACPRRTLPSWLSTGPEPLGPRVEPRVEFQA